MAGLGFACDATAEQIVIVREARNAPDSPFTARVRTVQRIDGTRVREEMTMVMTPVLPDSLDLPAPPDTSTRDPLEWTSVWVPGDRVWRMWSAREGKAEYQEKGGDELARELEDDEGSLSGIREIFGGTNPSIVYDTTVLVDSSGAEETRLGLRVRSYEVRGIQRISDLETDQTDSLRFVRRLRITRSLPGAEGLPAITPAAMGERSIGALQFLMLPMFEKAARRLDEEVAKLGGFVLEDELRVEAADVPAASAGAPPDTAKSALVFAREVVEIRREPSRPELFQVPAGYRRAESATPRNSASDR